MAVEWKRFLAVKTVNLFTRPEKKVKSLKSEQLGSAVKAREIPLPRHRHWISTLVTSKKRIENWVILEPNHDFFSQFHGEKLRIWQSSHRREDGDECEIIGSTQPKAFFHFVRYPNQPYGHCGVEASSGRLCPFLFPGRKGRTAL